MKKKITMALFLIVCFFSFLIACSDSSIQNGRSSPHNTQDIVVGIIENVDSQIIIMSEENDYKVSGIDLSQEVGKKVKITGIITESEGQFTLTVHSYKEVAFDDS